MSSKIGETNNPNVQASFEIPEEKHLERNVR